MTIPFYEWVSYERKGSSVLHKLSQDIRENARAPKKADTLKEWQEYLQSKNVPEKTIKVLEAAWALYWDPERRELYHDY